MSSYFALLYNDELRKKIFYSLIALLIYRIGSHIPISGVNLSALNSLFSEGGILGFFNLFSGGALSRFSIFALGILPYINASIIMQLMTIVLPKLKDLAEDSEFGRKKISQITRYLTVFLAFLQGLMMVIGFKNFVSDDTNFFFFLIYAVMSLVAASTFVMWLGELITENGIGNGASLLIFTGIIAQIPSYINNTVILVKGGTSIFSVLLLFLIFILIILSIVYIQEAERRVTVQYAKRIIGRKMMSGQSSFIPLRLIQGGVMPIIFASAILQFPLMFSQYINIDSIVNFFNTYYTYDSFFYNLVFCILIFFFTYFYTAITFNPSELADNIRKNGGFILGVRPGLPTIQYLEKIITKLTFIGAVFLALVALVPTIAANLTNVTSFMGLGGTALLIIVGVAMDLVKQIDTFIIARRYEGLIKR
jgi:preprotein translocase subunit SecY